MIGNRYAVRFENNGLENNLDHSSAHGTLRSRAGLSAVSDPQDQEESTGANGYPAPGIEHNVVDFLVRAIPVVEGFGHRAGHVPPNPEKYCDPEQPSFHSFFISQSEFGGQLVNG